MIRASIAITFLMLAIADLMVENYKPPVAALTGAGICVLWLLVRPTYRREA